MFFRWPKEPEVKKHWELSYERGTYGDVITTRHYLVQVLFNFLYYNGGNVHGWDAVRDNDLSMNWVFYGPESTRISDLEFY